MKSLYFREKDIIPILKETKTKTCRPISQAEKFNVGDSVKLFACHSAPNFATVKIVSIELIEDVNKISLETVKELGYKTRREYLAENFNENNEDKKRICLTFRWQTISIDGYCQHFRNMKYEKQKELEKQESKKELEEYFKEKKANE